MMLRQEDGAIYQIIHIHRNGLSVNSRPRIQLTGDWLTEIGFVSGALVQTLPEPDGFVFNLCNENINYSELYHATKEKGGTLIRLYVANQRTIQGPVLVTTGKHICSGGLKLGDMCIAKCEYGCIRVRKVKGNIRLIPVARTKTPYTGEPIPMISLFGGWLNDIGFTRDTLMTVATEQSRITITAYDKAVIYSEIVKYARQNKMKLIQVSTKYGEPLISIQGSCAVQAGFGLGDIFAAEYEHGVIKLQKFDPNRFGFPEAESPGN